jgi:AraC-like DNA-binding protein
MTDRKRLYERIPAGRAGLDPGLDPGLGPVWYVDAVRTFFAGPLTYNAMHQHGAPVFLAGIYGPFRLRIHGDAWLSCRTAVIPAGVRHELDVSGEPIGVFYIEPSLDGAEALMPLMRDVHEVGGAVVGMAGEFSLIRELWEDGSCAGWVDEALDDLLIFSRQRARRSIDARVADVIGRLQMHDEELVPVARLAAAAGLSASRFQYLFTREVGVAFRRYRAWIRMRRAIGEIASGSNFTTAAHAAGFADQSHFTHDFRRTFGAPPSRSLVGVRM